MSFPRKRIYKAVVQNGFAILGSGMLCSQALAAVAPSPLTIDSTFGGGNGRVVANYSDFSGTGSSTYFNDVENTPDGKIVAVGHTSKSANEFASLVVKYNLDGTLDTSFDDDGKLVLSLSDDDKVFAAATQADGKILVAVQTKNGTSPSKGTIIRLNQDGSLDTDFATNGRYTINPFNSVPNASVIPKDIAISTDGKIIILYHELFDTTSFVNKHHSNMVRLNMNGSRDTSFAGGRIFAVHYGQINEHSIELNTISLDDQDNIYLTGRMVGVGTSAARYSLLVGKYDSDGNTTSFSPSTTGHKSFGSPTKI
ncbi:delta-60 repeat domain-containing protein [Vibrio penaeicida]|uniref:Delta-60 repeat domain-containing protein n=1 Tax=Vibrio penaeicida TaxID=104609 RepID=A0AAV5P185_9VIBR|nr:delta-60 repeat domain-containing protein [Vibrio penaeicida]RTZ21577.1 hypothetical protein EKN09_18525 [Vibrio penaeicida]GLQ76483.1 hypothetical protein GCM10007932_58460 [Vibrio penaeicida]